MMALKKAHASVVAQKNAKIKELQDQLVETEALAGDVAKEYGTLESTIAEAAKCNAAKEDRLVRSAAQRLEKVKQSKALLQQQKYDFAEEQQATHEYTIELMEEVDALKQQIEVLGSELIDAYHTIEELTPPTIEKKGHPKTWDARLTQLIVEMLGELHQHASVQTYCPQFRSYSMTQSK
jgi:chromosome segregation ATPase